jgi:heme/copper-type cytochrome/quinol oxidase subunit 3
MSAADVSTFARAGRGGRSLGWWGMAMFVASEATLFAVMTATYFYLRFKNLAWPPAGIPEPKPLLPLLLLAMLAASSVPMRLAYRSGRAGRLASARWLLAAALIVQAGYLALAVHAFADDLARFGPGSHAYGSIYFTLLGADHAHVVLGLLLDLWLVGKLTRGLTRYRLNALQAISFYWQAVVVITAVVTLTTLSPAL